MAVPGFQEFMLPLLRLLGDGRDRTLVELDARLGDEFDLSDVERTELLQSGGRTRLRDRVGWARTHLRQAGLIMAPVPGQARITEAGQALLAERPVRVDMPFLLARYPSYREFRQRSGTRVTTGAGVSPLPMTDTSTPLDVLEASHAELRAALAEEVLGRVVAMTPVFFERLVVDLMLKLGYGAGGEGRTVGRSGDGGIDGIISEDRLGLESIYLQAKRYGKGAVGRPAIQAFVGSLEGNRATKGVFITTASFSADAHAYVKTIAKRVVLIDGLQLAHLMIDVQLGVVPERTYVVARVDSDYFVES